MSRAKFVLQPELCFEETYVLDRTCGDHMCGDFDRSYVWWFWYFIYVVILIDHMSGDFNRSYVWWFLQIIYVVQRLSLTLTQGCPRSFDRSGGKLIRFFIFSNWSDSLFLTTQWQRACSALITRWFILVSFFAPPLIHRPCFCCLRVRAAATVARASYNWVWFPCWSIHPSHYAGNKKFMFDKDQNHCDNDNEIIWFPIGNTDTDMLRLPLLIIIEIREVVK